ncbi:MAG: WbqC family protein [Saprospiraceae bacterium]|nr:WbqC family protein [Saprospiraceae bacterium]MCF8248521.1 WbqC family protein [Saprospiraceae bacterium]MCF8280592.1 WbqC family protein [Bacteroidales bacterium]MCF8310255.1 WbqC family protein [Saprospiraceae bacterium]MCF8439306.1 WbqC family protein [Saprospiraceae bacterium]
MNIPMEKSAIVLPLFYCPPVSWFVAFANATTAYLEQHENYVKGSYRNRCQVAAVNGPQRLTVPLKKGKNQQQPIRDVRIAYDEPWQIRHWRALCTAYGNSPFFEHYAELYEPFFTDKKYEFLWDWNYDLLMVSMDILKLKNPINLTTKYEPFPEGILDSRNAFHSKLITENIDYKPVKYPQVFEDRLGFLPDLSILDLIFCAGRLGI